MKKILFKRLFVKNFLSIGSSPVIIDFTSGINLITGVNLDKEDASNGSGKSSLINAICFCLYGKPLKDLKTDQIPNTYTKGACEVTLEIEVNDGTNTCQYEVMRSLRPSKLKLVKDGKDITKSTIAQTSELLQNIINCSNTVFEKSIVMDANNATSFMSQKKVEKRKFLEGILNLDIFGEMLSIARVDFNNIKFEVDVCSSKLKDGLSLLDTYKSHYCKQEKINQDRKNIIEDKISQTSLEIEALKNTLKQELSSRDIQKIEDKILKLKELEKSHIEQFEALIKEKISLECKKTSLQSHIEKLSKLVDVCDVCEREYTVVDRENIETKKQQVIMQLNTIDSEIFKNKTTHSELQEQKNKIDASLKLLLKRQQSIKIDADHNETINWKISQLQQTINDLNKSLSTDVINEYQDLVREQEEKVQELQSTVSEKSIKLEILQSAKFILSEEGVRSYIVKKLLKVLNSKLNGYLKKLDANARCEFNEFFEEVLWDHYGNERSYHNFSSGEQRRIDLAILFAFQDIRKLQADVHMNISIYDELLDSSLDRKGAELVLFLLKERAQKNKECVYIISHRKEAQSSHTSRVITLQKKNGITTLV
jgi:DNA repair exonuclease SbcCD ATPase subunit